MYNAKNSFGKNEKSKTSNAIQLICKPALKTVYKMLT